MAKREVLTFALVQSATWPPLKWRGTGLQGWGMSGLKSSRVLSSWFVGGRLRPSRQATAMAVAVAVAVALALTVTLVAAEPVSAAQPVAAKPKAEKVVSRPDVVSAQVTARAQGARVEVESLRDVTSTTWVNPDGTLTTQQHLGPIRFRDPSTKDAQNPKGAWRDVDLSMVELSDGTVGPKGHPSGLSLAGAGKAADGPARALPKRMWPGHMRSPATAARPVTSRLGGAESWARRCSRGRLPRTRTSSPVLTWWSTHGAPGMRPIW